MTSAMHTLHGPQINLDNNISLDNQTDPLKSCYLCHPGPQTKCERGAMHNTTCQSCHGNLTLVGNPARRGWLDVARLPDVPHQQPALSDHVRLSGPLASVDRSDVRHQPQPSGAEHQPVSLQCRTRADVLLRLPRLSTRGVSRPCSPTTISTARVCRDTRARLRNAPFVTRSCRSA